FKRIGLEAGPLSQWLFSALGEAGLPVILAELAGRYGVEIIDELAQRGIQRLKRQGYTNVEVRVGNGYARAGPSTPRSTK
ncbi:MAG: IS110 family transposase, partial [Xanthobacteraceae bacterium]